MEREVFMDEERPEQTEQEPPQTDPTLARGEVLIKLPEKMAEQMNARVQRFIEQDPANKERFEKDPEGVRGEIMRDILASIGRSPGLGRISREINERDEPITDSDTQEHIEIKSSFGGRVRVTWPKSPEGKINKMREILGRVEDSGEPDGGIVNKQKYEELARVISALKEDKDEEKRRLAEKMYSEFEARILLNATYLQYEKSGDGEVVANTLKSLDAKRLNVLLRLPGVWKALVYYEQFADDYIRLGTEQRDEGFRRPLRSQLESDSELQVRARADIEKIIGHKVEGVVDMAWAQTIGERLWSMTGRRAARDLLISKDPSKKYGDSFEKQRQEGDVRFADEVTGGNSIERRVLRFQDWVDAQKKEGRLFAELMDGVDLGTKDFFSSLALGIETYYKNHLLRELTQTDIEVSAGEWENAQKEAERLTSKLLGGVQKENPSAEEAAQGKKPSWPRSLDWHNLEGIDWGKIDLNVVHNTPLGDWAANNISSPDKARDVMTGKKESYLRSPSDQSLKNLIDSFAFQREGQYATTKKLLVNFVKFMRSDRAGEAGVIKMNLGAADTALARLGRDFKLNENELQEAGEKAFGKGPWVDMKIFLSQINARNVLFVFIWELFLGVLKEGFNLKKAA